MCDSEVAFLAPLYPTKMHFQGLLSKIFLSKEKLLASFACVSPGSNQMTYGYCFFVVEDAKSSSGAKRKADSKAASNVSVVTFSAPE